MLFRSIQKTKEGFNVDPQYDWQKEPYDNCSSYTRNIYMYFKTRIKHDNAVIVKKNEAYVEPGYLIINRDGTLPSSYSLTITYNDPNGNQASGIDTSITGRWIIRYKLNDMTTSFRYVTVE